MQPDAPPERVLIYVGPSVERAEVLQRVPDALLRPPARAGDVVTDLHRLQPTHLLLIDGEFHQELSVWHKELVYALVRGVRVYGAASMGALRAADLADVGMVGVGKVFWWYYEGVVEDDAEVAVSYSVDGQGNYRSTVPLVNVRASHRTQTGFEHARRTPWWDRWKCPCLVDQKRLDAIELLDTFRGLEPLTAFRPSTQHLSGLFYAQQQRDRRIDVQGVEVPLQAIDACVALNAPDRHGVFWNATNRALCLVLADLMKVEPTPAQVEREGVRHCVRCSLTEPGSLDGWLAANGLNPSDFERLMAQNARIRLLQDALRGNRVTQRRTQDVNDYLRSVNQFEPWAKRAAHAYQGNTDAETERLESDSLPETEWRERSRKRGIPVDSTFEEFLREYGFHLYEELNVAFARDIL